MLIGPGDQLRPVGRQFFGNPGEYRQLGGIGVELCETVDEFVKKLMAFNPPEVYAWTIRRSLPPVPIPLLPPDADVRLDLAVVVNETYEWGRYDDVIDYTAPLTVPLGPEERAWAEEIARGLAQAPPV